MFDFVIGVDSLFSFDVMKKILFIGMIFGGLALTSCKKDYECVYSYPNGSGGTITESHPYDNVKNSDKAAAKANCDLVEGTFSVK